MPPHTAATTRIAELSVGGDPAAWQGLGFRVDAGTLGLGSTLVRLGGGPGGIRSWTLTGVDDVALDGLATRGVRDAPATAVPAEHPNGTTRIDHVVVRTPSLDRTVAALEEAGLELRRVREAGPGVRQGFVWVGDTILELVEAPGPDPAAPATFWGLVVVVDDLERTARAAGESIGAIRDAVQPGRRIATVREEAGVGVALAFMTPHVKEAR